MSWTDERVERLSRLWLEGLSASQIAADLGEGVSRNAVIGKVHRLGLSGRATTSAAEAAVADPAGPTAGVVAAAPSPIPTDLAAFEEEDDVLPEAPVDGPVAPSAEVRVETSAALAPVPVSIGLAALRPRDVALPQTGRVTILELGATMCRWPLGDPTSAEFRFCGCRVTNGLPYCPDHARVAFQPVTDRRRVERMVRIA